MKVIGKFSHKTPVSIHRDYQVPIWYLLRKLSCCFSTCFLLYYPMWACDQSCFILLPIVSIWPIMFYFAAQCGRVTNHVFLLPNVSMWPIIFFFFATQCGHVTNHVLLLCFPSFFFFFFHVRTFLEWPNLVHKLISKGEINISETGLHSLLVALG